MFGPRRAARNSLSEARVRLFKAFRRDGCRFILIANGRVSAQEMAEIAPAQRGKFAVVDSGDGPPNGAIR